jgi:cytochrome c oxidase subunit 2
MALAIARLVVVLGSVAFHFWSPWWWTPIASNWGSVDTTIIITFVVTGVVFVAVNLFMLALVRYRHRPGLRAAYEPHNKKLEWWLTGVTSAGVIAMLAPGLVVYADMIHEPKDAAIVEAVGQQWQWCFRFPGKDGELGTSDIRFVSADNPLGVNPDDPKARDDVIVDGADGGLAAQAAA